MRTRWTNNRLTPPAQAAPGKIPKYGSTETDYLQGVTFENEAIRKTTAQIGTIAIPTLDPNDPAPLGDVDWTVGYRQALGCKGVREHEAQLLGEDARRRRPHLEQ